MTIQKAAQYALIDIDKWAFNLYRTYSDKKVEDTVPV